MSEREWLMGEREWLMSEREWLMSERELRGRMGMSLFWLKRCLSAAVPAGVRARLLPLPALPEVLPFRSGSGGCSGSAPSPTCPRPSSYPQTAPRRGGGV